MTIRPDTKDYEAAAKAETFATASEADKYRLAQAAKLIRLYATPRDAEGAHR